MGKGIRKSDIHHIYEAVSRHWSGGGGRIADGSAQGCRSVKQSLLLGPLGLLNPGSACFLRKKKREGQCPRAVCLGFLVSLLKDVSGNSSKDAGLKVPFMIRMIKNNDNI